MGVVDRARRENRTATRIGRAVRWSARVAVVTAVSGLLARAGGPVSARTPALGVQGGEAATRAAARDVQARLPLSFVENRGQTDARVRFQARTSNYSVFLTPDAAVFSFRDQRPGHARTKRPAITMRFAGAQPSAPIEGLERLPGVSHFYRGNDPRKWRTDVPHYARARYRQPWPGVDVVFRGGDERQLEYDFVLAPGADPAAIALQFSGMASLSLQNGDLVLGTTLGKVRHRAPLAYQDLPDGRHVVGSRYVERGPGRIGFEVDAFDTHYPLVIDPKVIYSTFLGGTQFDDITDVALLSKGGARQVVVTGVTTSDDFPGAEQPVDDAAAFVARVDDQQPGKATLKFLVVLDGPTDLDAGLGITSDREANIYVTGQAGRGFPLVDPFDDTASGTEAFVTKLDLEGKILYSTYLGGQNNDTGHAIRVHDNGGSLGVEIYVAGETQGRFPLKNAFQGCGPSFGSVDAFLTVLRSDGQSLAFSTCFGGGRADRAFGLDLDGPIAVVVGETFSRQFPTKSGSSSDPPLQSELAGESDAFVARFNPNASSPATLEYSTLLGGRGVDRAVAVAVDPQTHHAYVTGSTVSEDFPLRGPFDAQMNGAEAFVARINGEGTALVYSSFLGGTGLDNGHGIAIDATGAAHLVGTTEAPDFPGASKPPRGQDAFLTKIAPDGSHVLYSQLFGGAELDVAGAIVLDFFGSAYVAGGTTSPDFPTTTEVPQRTAAGLDDGFLMHLAPVNPDTVGTFTPSVVNFSLRNTNTSGPPDLTVQFGALGDVPIVGDWDGDGVTTVGVFRNGTFFLSDDNVFNPGFQVQFGLPGDVPVAGDWDGDGVDTIGVFRNGTFFLRNTNFPGNPDIVFAFGAPGDVPVAGDWDGDGIDTIGLFRFGTFLLRNSNSAGNPDIDFAFGSAVDRPVAGDWDGDGIDTVGVFGSRRDFHLRNSNSAGPPDVDLVFGAAGDFPIAGDWNGVP
jgi:hypothetical protein